MLTVTYAECHIKAPYDEYHYAECRGALNWDLAFSASVILMKRQKELQKVFIQLKRPIL